MGKTTSTFGSVSVVVPVYNSAGSLPEFVGRLENVLLDASADFEVVLVNDGSQDRSWDVICQLTQDYDWVRGIGLMRNHGRRWGPRATQASPT